MNLDALYSQLTLKTNAKLALLVLDGLGDIASGGPDSSTPLEAACGSARTPGGPRTGCGGDVRAVVMSD